MTDLRLTFACRRYDRTVALEVGAVQPSGVRLTMVSLPPNETLTRQLRTAEFDVSEMSMSAVMIKMLRGERDFVALPVFISRRFRHGNIYLSPRMRGAAPGDLAGRRIGVPQYHSTAAVWIRGMLGDDFGLRADQVTWVRGGLTRAGLPERIPLELPDTITLEERQDRPLDQLLEANEIDALISAVEPRRVLENGSGVGRLFEDAMSAEAEYYARTGFFPIMHCVAVRRDIYDAHRWVAPALTDALVRAKDWAFDSYQFSGSTMTVLPWEQEHLARTRRLLGDDYWRYGIAASRHELEAMLRYLHDQGLASRIGNVEEIFPEEVLAN